MKIRTGFVTNSSSTSFCIVGAHFDTGDVVEVLEKRDDVQKLLDENQWIREEGLEYCFYEVEHLLEGVDVYSDSESHIVFLGLGLGKMRDDETLAQFKQRALDAIRALGLDISEVRMIQETIYN